MDCGYSKSKLKAGCVEFYLRIHEQEVRLSRTESGTCIQMGNKYQCGGFTILSNNYGMEKHHSAKLTHL